MEITRFRPRDRGELQRFLDAGFPDSPRSTPEFWNWVFRDNPDGTGGEEIWLLKDGGRVVGQLPTCRTMIRIAGDIRPARVTFDFLLLPEYRNRGGGPLLVRALNGDDGVLLNPGPNRAAFPLFARMGWRHTVVLPRAMAVLDPGISLTRFGLPSAAAKWVGAAGRPICGLLAEPPRARAADEVESVTRFGPEFDGFWNAWSARFPAALHRDARRMNWRFFECPVHRYDVLVRRAGGFMTGYLVMRVADHKGVPTGLVVEHAGEPEGAEALLRAALRRFAERGVGVVHTRLPHPDQAGLFQRAGFFVRSTASQIIRLMYLPGRGLDGPAFRSSRSWFVTTGDGDADW